MASLFDSLNDLADVKSLIEGSVRESEVLEYKTASKPFNDREKSELAKDASAMANSAGGVIIYGVSTDSTDKTKPVSIKPIDPHNVETFDRVLNSQIRPPLSGVRKKVIPAAHPQVMVVEVPGSENPPHQSLYDKKYYRRSGTESLPMEHDLIALLFGRMLGPILDLKFQTLQPITGFTGDDPRSNEGIVRVLIENLGRRVGRFVQVVLLFPPSPEVVVRVQSGNTTNIDNLYSGRQARQFSQDVSVFHPRMRVSILELGLAVGRDFVRTPMIRSWSGQYLPTK